MASSQGSTLCSLANAPINLLSLREVNRKQIFELIDSVPVVKGKKALVLDEQLSGPLGMVVEASGLRAQGIDAFYHLQPELETDCSALIYVIRPKVHLVEMICEHIMQQQRQEMAVRCVICYVPRSSILCERVLVEYQLTRKVQVTELALDLIPVDNDVLSMEMQNEHRECKLDGDFTSLYNVARSLMKLQSTYGLIPHIAGKGSLSKQVCDMMIRMRRELGDETVALSSTTSANVPSSGTHISSGGNTVMSPQKVSVSASLGGPFSTLTPEIDALILIDRDTDLVTPMLSMLTYEGFIDEVFGIKNSCISVDPEIVSTDKEDVNAAKPDDSGKKKKVIFPLNSNDRLYFDIRDRNFASVFKLLSRKAKEINEYYEQRHSVKEVSQLRDFVKRLGGMKAEHQSLAIHTRLAEIILKVTKSPEFQSRLEIEQTAIVGNEIDFLPLEDVIVNRSQPLPSIIRLLILICQTVGIKSKKYDQLKTDIVQSFGYEAMFTLENLERMGVIKRGEKGAFSALRKPLRLFSPDVNETDPNDISYLYSGYAPLSARIVEHALSHEGFKGKDDVFKQLPGPTFEYDQPLPRGIQYTKPSFVAQSTTQTAAQTTTQSHTTEQERTPVVLVFYIGGVTVPEISAMRFISKNEASNVRADIIVGATSIVNGRSLSESYCEYFKQFPFPPVNVPKSIPVAQAIKPTQERDRDNTGFVIGGRGVQNTNEAKLGTQLNATTTTSSSSQPKRVWGVK